MKRLVIYLDEALPDDRAVLLRVRGLTAARRGAAQAVLRRALRLGLQSMETAGELPPRLDAPLATPGLPRERPRPSPAKPLPAPSSAPTMMPAIPVGPSTPPADASDQPPPVAAQRFRGLM